MTETSNKMPFIIDRRLIKPALWVLSTFMLSLTYTWQQRASQNGQLSYLHSYSIDYFDMIASVVALVMLWRLRRDVSTAKIGTLILIIGFIALVRLFMAVERININ